MYITINTLTEKEIKNAQSNKRIKFITNLTFGKVRSYTLSTKDVDLFKVLNKHFASRIATRN